MPGAGFYPRVQPAANLKRNKRKIEHKELSSCSIFCLIFAYTQQLEILVTDPVKSKKKAFLELVGLQNKLQMDTVVLVQCIGIYQKMIQVQVHCILYQ